jgi:hypothetical protein
MDRRPPGPRPKVLFVLGNHNHNTMLHQVAQAMPDAECWFTPYYCDDWTLLDLLRRLNCLEFIALGNEFRRRCLRYCADHGLAVDLGGVRHDYDLAVTCSDLLIPENLRTRRLIGIQEGMIDPLQFLYRLRQRFTFLPRWTAGTACTGLSGLYDRYCVASEGYRAEFITRGAPGHRLAVTGIPNYDNLAGYRHPGHWIEGHVLACTSDGRETFRRDDRIAFIRRCVEIADGRPLIFKFHPNERMSRAIAEVRRHAPGARWITEGRGEELAANCAVLITEWSTLAFVGLALGIETHSYRDLDELRALVPLQHGRAADNIADVCRELLATGRPLATRIRGVA